MGPVDLLFVHKSIGPVGFDVEMFTDLVQIGHFFNILCLSWSVKGTRLSTAPSLFVCLFVGLV